MWLGPEEVYAGAGFTAYLSFVALDSFNFPHVASHKGMSPSYFYSDGSNWYSNDGIQSHLNRAHGIALDGSDHPYISGSHSGNAVVCYYDGSTWSQDIVDNTATCYTVSLARDGFGHLHVAYRYASGGNKLKYGYNNGSGWTTQILDSTGNVEPCIVVDSNNYPHISYRSNSDNCLKIASWNGSDWDMEVVDSVGDVGFYSALTMATVDGTDYPFIVYSDGTTGNTRIKLAYDENSLGIETPSFVAESKSGCIRLTWRIEAQHEVARYLIQRKSSKENEEYSQIHSIPGPGSSPSPQTYSYEDEEVQSGMRYFYKLGVVASNGNTKWYGPVSAVASGTKPFMKVSPNPYTTVARIEVLGTSKDQERQLHILDASGRLVNSVTLETSPYHLGTDLTAGVYFLKLKVGEYIETKKIIKIR
jgi:hypothetical protein